MLLLELFNDSPMEVSDTLQQDIMDILTPLVARGVKEVTMQEVSQRLQAMRSGLVINRKLVMDLLDPDSNKLIGSINGDKVALKTADETPQHALGAEDAKREQERMSDKAANTAKAEMKKKADPAKPPPKPATKAPPKPAAKAPPMPAPDDIKIGN